jgi:hypothetical protein
VIFGNAARLAGALRASARHFFLRIASGFVNPEVKTKGATGAS